MRKVFYLVSLFMVGLFGFGLGAYVSKSIDNAVNGALGVLMRKTKGCAKTGAAKVESCAETGAVGLVVKSDFPNHTLIEFIFPKPIAPDFHVGYGLIGRSFESFMEDDPEQWDPMGIGTEKVMNLINHIRKSVNGVTENIYAQGYTLTVNIAESHLGRKSEIIEEILAIAQVALA